MGQTKGYHVDSQETQRVTLGLYNPLTRSPGAHRGHLSLSPPIALGSLQCDFPSDFRAYSLSCKAEHSLPVAASRREREQVEVWRHGREGALTTESG